MDRRIVVYENNVLTGHGEPVYTYVQHVNQATNILERDYANFILQAEKSRNRPVNPMLVVKYILKGYGRWNSIFEAIDYLFHSKDFKPYIAPLPHVEEKKQFRDTTRKDLEKLRV